jgi:hypothetical protein
MSSKKKTTTAQTVVQTPSNPDWITQPVQGVANQISQLGQADPGSFIAGPDPLQTQAATSAAKLGSDTSWYDKIMGAQTPDIKAQQVQSQSLLDGLQGYMSPYTQNVVDTTLADFDANAGKTRAQQTLDLAGSGAFGGSGSAITRSMTEDNLARARASAEATLRDQAFTTGAGLSNSDAARRQDASSQNATNQLSADTSNAGLLQQLLGLQAQTGLSKAASDRSDIALQGDLGGQLQALAQQKAAAPLNLLQMQTGLLSGLPLDLFHGQTQQTDGTTTEKSSFAPFTGGTSLLAGLGGATAGTAGLTSALGAAAKTMPSMYAL